LTFDQLQALALAKVHIENVVLRAGSELLAWSAAAASFIEELVRSAVLGSEFTLTCAHHSVPLVTLWAHLVQAEAGALVEVPIIPNVIAFSGLAFEKACLRVELLFWIS
jgi:hypothetical protein